MRVVIAGGTGLIGNAIVQELLRRGDRPVVLSRSASPQGLPPGARAVLWDGRFPGSWASEVSGSGAVINLAGEPIAGGRWTPSRKQAILSSRTGPTAALVSAIRAAVERPAVLVNASASGYYGDVAEGDVTESGPPGTGFLAEVAAAWEGEARHAESLGVRVVLPRISVVLAARGGALPRLALPFRFFAGGHLGSGRQYFPWIHVEDLVGLILFALDTPSLSGPVNASAPEVPRMREFCRTLGQVLGRPSWTVVPGSLLKLALGEMAGMLLGGQNTVPARALAAGYTFRYPTLTSALNAIFPAKGGRLSSTESDQ